ncbi:MAG: hydrogenase maturation protease [Acidobacteriia bacterium]|nr:hydrogenase maturation protease [Terriglobia bacterium]
MIYVLGLGNVLMGDDGFGPTVVREFSATHVVGADVEVVDVGTPGLDMMPWLYDAHAVIIVDTIKSDARPGTLRVYDKKEILHHAPSVRVGPHDPGVKEALLTLEFAGRGPRDVVLVGVVPGDVGMALELTDPVRDAVPAAVEVIAGTLRRFGVPVAHVHAEPGPAPWWQDRHV